MKKKYMFLISMAVMSSMGIQAQKPTRVTAPDNSVSVVLEPSTAVESGWMLRVQHINATDTTLVCTIPVGLSTEQQQFNSSLSLSKTGAVKDIHESYTMIHGKRSQCTNDGRELTYTFRNSANAQCDLILRVYNDGVTFRYALDAKKSKCKDGNVILGESTAYCLPEGTQRWLESWNVANENLYDEPQEQVKQGSWCYPALFCNPERNVWSLVSESDVDRNNCASRLNNDAEANQYQVAQPTADEGRGTGTVSPVVTMPWQSPWRVVMVGSLANIVESTLVDDVARPSTIKNTDWIKPGLASWNYWSSNHGTQSYETVCEFADLAVAMGWPYTLIDWEWDVMHATPEHAASLPHGGNLEDAIAYIKSKGIKPLMWYNSCGEHTWATSTPKNRMLTHESRVKEFTWLNELGVKGVKVDFFECEKQHIMQYYLDIIEDAAAFNMMVYFHGCIIPRGWARTYPNVMTYEGVRGGEWYDYDVNYSRDALRLNCILPYTRNVVGSMDYTPVTFTNAQNPHLTSFGHELALTVVFESGMQHMADRPEGYLTLPEKVKGYLAEVPAAWDDTRFLDGMPGERVVLARRTGESWCVGGITSNEGEEWDYDLSFNFLPEGKSYKLLLMSDGTHDHAFAISEQTVTRDSVVKVHVLRRGGFVAQVKPL